MTYQEYKNHEKLGDAVLRLVLVETFVMNFTCKRPEKNILIVKMQSNAYMDVIARQMSIEPHSEDKSKVRYANALEAKIGSIYFTEGMEAARAFIRKYNALFFKEFDSK